jgi:hypothetical protein
VVGLVLLFIYEGYKSHYFESKNIIVATPAPPNMSDFDTTMNDPTAENQTASSPQKGTTIINNYSGSDQADDSGR